MILMILFYVIIGAVTGLASGMLGIGGGLIIVPCLTFIFHYTHLTPEFYTQFAMGSSLGIMMFTGTSAIITNARLSRIHTKVYWQLLSIILPMCILGAVVARFAHGDLLILIFSITLLVMIFKLLRNKKEKHKPFNYLIPANEVNIQVSKRRCIKYGSIIGFISGMLGIGGSVISVPFLISQNLPIRYAAGTSSALSLPIALVGSISYTLLGIASSETVSYSSGFLYWPAIICVGLASMLTTPLGAKLSTITPPNITRRIFIVLLLFICMKMFYIVIIQWLV
ncbi:sulfite exporter TauE/SafE family protein [Thiotrichales bacterium 19S3-7]|nr:sulfite exporter TauE/SafE family protein [Thiotrichales bacterium 19S3-7]MCF6802018.1 sulfite exporter TauE/SafE family protein [Thiotrichales bacterium 19S3-11]